MFAVGLFLCFSYDAVSPRSFAQRSGRCSTLSRSVFAFLNRASCYLDTMRSVWNARST